MLLSMATSGIIGLKKPILCMRRDTNSIIRSDINDLPLRSSIVVRLQIFCHNLIPFVADGPFLS